MTKDFVEKATQEYLISLSLGEVIYEPNGPNSPPDFSLAGRIGVEATRLVDIIDCGSQLINLTEEEPKIDQSFTNAIRSVTRAKLGGSYFVCVDYQFPFDRRAAARAISKHLTEISNGISIIPHKLEVCKNVRVDIFPSSKTFESPFMSGGINCDQSGGLILADIIQQSRQSIQRKSKVISPIRGQYAEWWLAVSSHLTFGVENSYIDLIAGELRESGMWSKLLLIDAAIPTRSKIVSLDLSS